MAERGPDDPIVRQAVENVGRNIASLTASEVVQLVLYPESLAAWAAGAGVDDSQVVNLFRRHRRYTRLRGLLAARLGVPIAVLDHLMTPRRRWPGSSGRPPTRRSWPTPDSAAGRRSRRSTGGPRHTRGTATGPTRSSASPWRPSRWRRRRCRAHG